MFAVASLFVVISARVRAQGYADNRTIIRMGGAVYGAQFLPEPRRTARYDDDHHRPHLALTDWQKDVSPERSLLTGIHHFASLSV
eukprot:COSAG06_NODE_5909_length_3216_cov_205.108438_3_plen_85_part_00